MYTKTCYISWVIVYWKSNKQDRGVHGRCIDSFKFFRISLDETMTNAYFLAPFYCSGQLFGNIRK